MSFIGASQEDKSESAALKGDRPIIRIWSAHCKQNRGQDTQKAAQASLLV
jgi:hypothetical protein